MKTTPGIFAGILFGFSSPAFEDPDANGSGIDGTVTEGQRAYIGHGRFLGIDPSWGYGKGGGHSAQSGEMQMV